MASFKNRLIRYWLLMLIGGLWALGLPGLAEQLPLNIYWQEGPQTIAIGQRLATLAIPSGHLFAAADDTQAIMRYIGNPTDERDVGLVMSADQADSWMVVYSYDPIGYVADTDLNRLNLSDLLPKIAAATTQDNPLRQAQNLPNIDVTGWYQTPRYDQQEHQLSWAITAQDSQGQLVNYNIRKLGSQGVTSIKLVADHRLIPKLLPTLAQLVNNYRYRKGQRYVDFVPGQDRVATVSLASLIVGLPKPTSNVWERRGFPGGMAMLLGTTSLGLGLLSFGISRYRAYRAMQAAADALSELPVIAGDGEISQTNTAKTNGVKMDKAEVNAKPDAVEVNAAEANTQSTANPRAESAPTSEKAQEMEIAIDSDKAIPTQDDIKPLDGEDLPTFSNRHDHTGL